jgi:hypothetical protein
MSHLLVASYLDGAALKRSAEWAKNAQFELVDAFTPFPIEGMAELLGNTSTRLRVYMFLGGVAVAAAAYGIEGWSAVFSYPINSGGRPLNSWPAFMLFPFAVAIFGAAFTGLVALLLQTGLPRLHHPLFDINGFERATQDRFMLALEAPADLPNRMNLITRLREAGAENVWELEA